MSWAIRKFTLVAGAAALLSSQAAIAAPTARAPAVDPLVALSVFGTAQSRAAVCAAGASAAAAGAAVASAAQAPAPGCLLPLQATPTPPPATTEVVPPPLPPEPGKSIGTLPLLLGLVAIAALAAWLLLDDDDDDGELIPISP